MVNKEFFEALRALQEAKNIDQDFIISAMESALTAAYKKSFGQARSAEVRLNPEKNTIRIYSYLTVVEEVEDPEKEISLIDAKEISNKYKVGDIINREESMKSFNRIAVQTIKQVITQKIKEVERQEMLSNIAEKEGTLVTAIVSRIDGENIYLQIGGSDLEGLLTNRDILINDRFSIGDRVKVYVRPVKDEFKAGIIQVTRTNNDFIKKLFELEIPEIQNEELTVMNIARDSGKRTKISIKSNVPDIDIIGACVGNKSMRISSIIGELSGEKIDIVEYSQDPEEYIINAMSPATIIKVDLNENEKSAQVIVPQDKLSLAIGRGGQNVRLAVKLTGWKIDVKASTDKFYETEEYFEEANSSTIILDEDDDLFDDIDD